jgi:hypothetical protein
VGKYVQIFEENLRSGDFSLLTFFAWQAKKVDYIAGFEGLSHRLKLLAMRFSKP